MSVETLYIEPGSPWQNGYAESFYSRFRDEFLAVEEFESLAAARRLTNAWKEDYNRVRPHGSLDYRTPAASPPRVLLPLRLRLRSSNTRVSPLPPTLTNRYLHNVWYRNFEPVRGKLVSPARKRAAVGELQQQFAVSERRACRTLDQPRSCQRYEPTPRTDEAPLTKRMLELVRKRPRFGYRRIGRLLQAEGWRVGLGRVFRLWRKEGLKCRRRSENAGVWASRRMPVIAAAPRRSTTCGLGILCLIEQPAAVPSSG
jgi:hypothetical protein